MKKFFLVMTAWLAASSLPLPAGASVETQPTLETEGSATDAVTMMLFVSWLETSLPTFVQIFSERLYQYMTVAHERELARRFTEQEFKLHVVQKVQEKFSGELSDLEAHIQGSGIVASGLVRLGLLSYRLLGRVGVFLEEETPHLIIEEIRMGDQPVPGFLLRQIETRVNEAIDQQNHPLRIKEFQLYDGWAYVSVEIA